MGLMTGKATATANVIARGLIDAGQEAAAGRIRPQLADVLTAAQALRVSAVGGRWVADVHWWARIAIHARLAKCDTDGDGNPILVLTDAGRSAVTRLWASRQLGHALVVATARRAGREHAEEEFAAQQRAAQRIAVARRRHRLVGELAWWVFLFAAGIAAGVVTANGL